MNTNTVSGNIASFYTPRQVDLSSLKVHFSPKQLGEGDPSPSNVREIVPYTGVTTYHRQEIKGIRLIPVNFQEQTNNGVTLKYLGNGKYFFEGTSTSNTSVFDIEIEPIIVTGDWNYLKYNTHIRTITDYDFPMSLKKSDNTNIFLCGSPFSENYGDNIIGLYNTSLIGTVISKVRVVTTPNVTDLIMTPEIVSSLDTPIENTVQFCATGKNLLNMDSTWTTIGSGYTGTWTHDVGSNFVTIKNGNMGAGYTVHLNNNQTVTFSFDLNFAPVNAFIRQRIYILQDNNASRVANTIIDSNRAVTTYTATQDGDYIFTVTCNEWENEAPNGELIISNWQVENGSTATTYEKYISAVYGGYVDLITGELVMEYKLLHFIKNYISGVIESGFQNASQYYALTATIGNAASFKYKRELAICDKMKTIQSDLAKPELQSAEGLLIGERRWMFGLPSGITTLEGARNWMEEIGGFDLCYPIAEPIHYQLTPQQITSFLETNTIWSNADSVEVTYPVIPTCNLEKSRHNILASYPHKVTAESTDGAINNFGTDMVGPMVNLRVGFKPIQSGEGTPSPENVRTIEGTSGMVINTAGKNLAHIYGYGATSIRKITQNRSISNSYGTTLNTIDYSPDTPLIVTQTQWPESQLGSYKNGYFGIGVDSLQHDKGYNLSFKISNITNNPLNVSLSNIQVYANGGTPTYPTEIIDNKLIFKNILFKENTVYPDSYFWEIRNCGMSFTLSEFMVTEVNETDMSFVPYEGNTIDVVFPPFGKNYWNPEYMTASAVTYTTTNTGITVTSSSAGTFRHVVFKTSNITPDDIGKTFTFSTNATVTSGQARILVSIRNPDGTNFGTLLERASDTDQTLTGSFTIPSGFPDNGWFQCAFYCTGSAGGSGEVEYSNTQLELGSSATTYEEYIPLYGGYVDPVAGEIVAERVLITIDGTQTVQVRETYANSNQFRIAKSQLPIEPMTYNNEDVSSYMEVIMSGDEIETSLPWKFWVNSMTKAIHFLFPKSFTTVAQVQEYFAEHPLQICTRIQQPIHYSIDSHTLLTLRGANNIWSTANGDIAATYYTHGDQSTQWLPGEPIIDDNNMILTTSNGYAIGKEDDYIVY